MGSLLIVTGPPGAGKSTVARALAKRDDPSVLVAGDEFFAFLARGAIEPWLPAARDQNTVVTEAAARATARFAHSYPTVYDGVVGPWLLDTFAGAAELTELDYVILLPPATTCVERVRARENHGFGNEQACRKMHSEFAAADIDNRHILTASSTTAAETVQSIMERRSSSSLTYRPEASS